MPQGNTPIVKVRSRSYPGLTEVEGDLESPSIFMRRIIAGWISGSSLVGVILILLASSQTRGNAVGNSTQSGSLGDAKSYAICINWNTGGAAISLEAQAGKIYVGIGTRVVLVDRVSLMIEAVSSALDGAVLDISAVYPFVYAITTRGTLVTLFASPNGLITSDSTHYGAFVSGALDQDLFYVLDDAESTLIVFDGARRGILRRVGSIQIDHVFTKVIAIGRRAYVLGDALTAIDLGDGAGEPRVAWSAFAGKLVRDVNTTADRILIAADNMVFDMSAVATESNPTFRLLYTGADQITAVTSREGDLLVAVVGVGIVVLTGPTVPFSVKNQYPSKYPIGLVSDGLGDVLVLDAYDGLIQLNFHSQSSRKIALIPVILAYDVAIADNSVMVAAYQGGMYNIKDDGGIDWIATRGAVRAISVSGGRAAAAEMDVGVELFDLGVDGTWYSTGFIDTPGWAVDILFVGAAVYVADFYGGLRVLDIGSWPIVREAKTFTAAGFIAQDLSLWKDNIFVAGGPSGIWKVSVHDPTLPTLTTVIPVPSVNSVSVSGDNRLYAVRSFAIVSSIDLERGVELGTMELQQTVNTIKVGPDGNIYVAGEFGLLIMQDDEGVFDIVGRLRSDYIWNITFDQDDDRIYLSDNADGVFAIRVGGGCNQLFVPMTYNGKSAN